MIAPPSNTRRDGVTTDDWITPQWLLARLGPFDLDPCACDSQPWPTAKRMITKSEDGLMQPWAGLVWCNPPYGRALGTWLNRCALHNNAMALVFARTETKAFFKYVWPFASALLFLEGRLSFYRPSGEPARNGANSGGPSVLIAYGRDAAARLLCAADLGAFVFLQSTSL